jgi:predicted Zn finger-like uncharacterized protein
MILACPACSTRFAIEASALSPGGRRVRCGSCKHVWHQPAPQAEAGTVEEPLPALFAESPKEPKPEPLAAPRVVTETETPLRPPLPSSRTRLTPAPPPKRTSAAGLAWAALALVVIIVIGGAVVAREAVLAAFPQTERFYAMVGLTEAPVGAGLELRKVSWKRERTDGVSVLLIEGEVANVSQKVQQVPKIRGAILGQDKRELSFWTFPPPEPKLLPGEAVRFKTEVRNPPDEGRELSMNFARES